MDQPLPSARPRLRAARPQGRCIRAPRDDPPHASPPHSKPMITNPNFADGLLVLAEPEDCGPYERTEALSLTPGASPFVNSIPAASKAARMAAVLATVRGG